MRRFTGPFVVVGAAITVALVAGACSHNERVQQPQPYGAAYGGPATQPSEPQYQEPVAPETQPGQPGYQYQPNQPENQPGEPGMMNEPGAPGSQPAQPGYQSTRRQGVRIAPAVTEIDGGMPADGGMPRR